MPLLRVLPMPYNERQGKNVYEMHIPHYVPVSNTDTNVVEIYIRRDDGQAILFKGGKFCVTVHIGSIE